MPPSAEPPRGGERPGVAGRARSRLGAPILVPAALALAAALALWLGRDRLAGLDLRAAVASPESQVRGALARQDRAYVSDVYGFRSGGTAELRAVRFAEAAVSVERDRALVLARVEADGRVAWRDQAASVVYVGREAFEMSRCREARWCADGRQFANLRGVLTALFRRADAFQGRNAEAYARLVSARYGGEGGRDALVERLRADFALGPAAELRIRAWQIRVDRERAEIGEDYEIRVGDAPPERLRARYVLVLEDDRWVIADGL